jgi:DNA-binding IclR family transcriptional regulator
VSTSATSLPAAEHRTVARVMSILELVLASDPQGMRLGEISSALDAPKSSIHGLTKGLVATGYLREERGHYMPGPAISTLIAVGPASVPSFYHHAIEQLSARWNETTMLATLVGDSLVYLDSVEPEALIRAAPRRNQRLPLWPRSSGKCFLAFMEPKRLNGFMRRASADGIDEKSMREELDTVRVTRIGLNVGDTIAGHAGIASPIFAGEGVVTMAVAMAGPRSRMEEHIDEMSKDIRDVAESLSSRRRN